MFSRIKEAWKAGRTGQPLPARSDRSVGQTGAIVGIAGVSVLVVFVVAYGFGHAEKKAKEALERDRKKDKEELDDLKADAAAAKAELEGHDRSIEEEEEGEEEDWEGEEDLDEPCGRSGATLLHDEEPGLVIVDPETGDVRDAFEEPEPDGAEDLWPDHIQLDEEER